MRLNLLLILLLVIQFDDANVLAQANPCPANVNEAQTLIYDFLTKPELSEYRNLTQTNSLSVNQIQVLSNSSSIDRSKCNTLRQNEVYKPADEGIRATVYYKAGNFYFVSKPIVKKEALYNGETVIISGPHFLSVLDQNLNEIETFEL